MNHETFPAKEALDLLGTEVRLCLERGGLPIGTPGRIVQVRRGGQCKSGFTVAVQWQSSCRQTQGEFTKTEFKRFLIVPLSTA
jgi:hypothetical protein